MKYFIFITFISTLIFYYFNFQFLKFFLRMSFKEKETKKVEKNLRITLAKKISKHYRNISESYIMKCFDRYPNVVISYRKKEIKGCYFFSEFQEEGASYYYLGPTFFLDKLSLSSTYFHSFLQAINKKEQTFFMAELQNPELIMHIHYAFPKSVFPQAKTFYVSERAKEALSKFSKKITQLDELDMKSFKSKGNSSLYYPSKKKHLVSDWLENNNIYLNQNESLILIFDLDTRALREFKKRLIYGLLTYPSHKTKYIKDLQEFLSHA